MTETLQRADSRSSVGTRISALDLRDPTVIAVALLTLFTFVLRFSQIHQSLLGDEVFTYQDIFGRSFRAVLTNVHTGGENSPPLFFLFAYATAKLGDPTVWIRLPSIVLGAATIPVIYLIARETVGRAAGLTAGAVLALSPFSFYYGVEARPYATMAFFVAVSTWALLRAVETNRRAWWATYVLAAGAAAYSHYTSIFVLVVEGVWSLWACRDRIRAPLISGALAALLYVPWLPNLRGKELSVISELEPLTAHNVLVDLGRPIAGYPYAPLAAIPTYLGLGLVILAALAGAITLAVRALVVDPRRARPSIAPGPRSDSVGSPWPRHFWLLVSLALATPVGLLVYSIVATDLWLARGLYASVPAGVLVLGALLVAIPRPFNVAAVVLVLGALLIGTFRAGSTSWERPPFRTLAAYLDRAVAPGDPVSFVSFFGEPAILAQSHRPHHVVASPALWRSVPPGGDAFLVMDDRFARKFGISPVPPAPRGFALVNHRHYSSAILPTDVSVYHRLSGG